MPRTGTSANPGHRVHRLDRVGGVSKGDKQLFVLEGQIITKIVVAVKRRHRAGPGNGS